MLNSSPSLCTLRENIAIALQPCGSARLFSSPMRPARARAYARARARVPTRVRLCIVERLPCARVKCAADSDPPGGTLFDAVPPHPRLGSVHLRRNFSPKTAAMHRLAVQLIASIRTQELPQCTAI